MKGSGGRCRPEAPARYFDGRSARPVPVSVRFGERSLVIGDDGGAALAHWPLAPVRAASARGDPTLQLAPDGESDERLVLDDPAMISAVEAACPDLRRRPVGRRGGRRALLLGLVALAAVAALVFAILPDLAGRLARAIPAEREAQLGDALADHVREALGSGDPAAAAYCRDPRGVAALDKMVARLAPAVDVPYALRVSVVAHPMANALTLPGGRILLLGGLIDGAESPEEVAGVLAHEIGHVVHRDVTEGLLRAAGTAGILGMLAGDVVGASVAVAASEVLLRTRYARAAERRADETAFAVLEASGLPRAPLGAFFARIAESAGATPAALDYISTHPAPAGRAERARASDAGSAGEGFEPVLTDAEWIALRDICSRTSDSPRF